MKTISLISQKGGAGKSTLTINLAGVAAACGRAVVIADADPQQSVFDWYKTRRESAPMPYVASAHANQVKDVVERAAANGADFVFIDTSPNSTEESLAIAACADFLVVPCAPALIDLRALTRTKSVVDFAGKPAIAVLNQVPHYGNEADQAAEALRNMGFEVCPHRIGNRAAARRPYTLAQTASEFEPGGAAAQEFEAVFDFICAHVGMSACVHDAMPTQEVAHV
ncbi:MAG: ParA family protein [Pseudomonadota bacterium]